MRALGIVCENFELGIRIDRRLIGEQQIVVELVRVGLLGVGRYDHFSGEHGFACPVENAFVSHAAEASRDGVLDMQGVIDGTVSVIEVEPVEFASAVLALEFDAEFVPNDLTGNGDVAVGVVRVSPFDDLRGHEMVTRFTFSNDLVADYGRVVTDDYFGDGVGEIGCCIRNAHVGFHDADFGRGADDEEIARMRYDGFLAGGNVERVYWRFNLGVVRDFDIGAVLHERGV